VSPVLPIVLCHENKSGTQYVLDIWREDVSETNAAEGGTVSLQLGGKKTGADGARAEPAEGSVYIEHGSEYFCVEVG
jgi:hypothetical protein